MRYVNTGFSKWRVEVLKPLPVRFADLALLRASREKLKKKKQQANNNKLTLCNN